MTIWKDYLGNYYSAGVVRFGIPITHLGDQVWLLEPPPSTTTTSTTSLTSTTTGLTSTTTAGCNSCDPPLEGNTYRVTLSGLTGIFALYNGAHDLDHLSGCTWGNDVLQLAWGGGSWIVSLNLETLCRIDWVFLGDPCDPVGTYILYDCVDTQLPCLGAECPSVATCVVTLV